MTIHDEPAKPRNVLRPLPRLTSEAISAVAYAEAKAVPSLRQERRSEFARSSWHAIIVVEGFETVAAAHLVARRFGVYLPVKDGRPFLPGYVFLWAWDLDAQWSRVTSAPGVGGVLASGLRAAPIPDVEIDKLRAREAGWEMEDAIRKGTKGWRRIARKREDASETVASPLVSDWVSLIETLPASERTSAFEKAMGIVRAAA